MESERISDGKKDTVPSSGLLPSLSFGTRLGTSPSAVNILSLVSHHRGLLSMETWGCNSFLNEHKEQLCPPQRSAGKHLVRISTEPQLCFLALPDPQRPGAKLGPQ